MPNNLTGASWKRTGRNDSYGILYKEKPFSGVPGELFPQTLISRNLWNLRVCLAMLQCYPFGQRATEKGISEGAGRIGDHIRERQLDLNYYRKMWRGSILGVDTNTASNWEKNRCGPKLYLMPRIVRFLGYNPFTSAEGATMGKNSRHFAGCTA